MTRDDICSLAHSKWNCKYHIVFAPKYRRMVIYKQIKTDIGRILRKLCEQKGVEIIEAEACPDMGYLKGKSSLMIFDRHANLNIPHKNER